MENDYAEYYLKIFKMVELPGPKLNMNDEELKKLIIKRRGHVDFLPENPTIWHLHCAILGFEEMMERIKYENRKHDLMIDKELTPICHDSVQFNEKNAL